MLGTHLDYGPDSEIKHVGTPINEINEQELPSPVAKKQSKDNDFLPFTFSHVRSDSSSRTRKHAEEGQLLRKRDFGELDYLKEFQKVSLVGKYKPNFRKLKSLN